MLKATCKILNFVRKGFLNLSFYIFKYNLFPINMFLKFLSTICKENNFHNFLLDYYAIVNVQTGIKCFVRFFILEIFQRFMNKSQKSLDTMFEETYGSRYESNNYVFKSLYLALHQYINGSELDLESTVDLFFAKLHEKIYVMSHPFSKFDKKYENCINENTNFVRPFGDIQQKIGQQTSRSFMAARMFLHSLKEANNIVSELSQMPFHDECSVAFMRMTQCSICSGVSSGVKPCLNYCKNIMKGCYSYIILIQPKWNEFFNNLITLAQKLEGPFSVEAVVEPLGVKISEAIMIFQENQGNITAKVNKFFRVYKV